MHSALLLCIIFPLLIAILAAYQQYGVRLEIKTFIPNGENRNTMFQWELHPFVETALELLYSWSSKGLA